MNLILLTWIVVPLFLCVCKVSDNPLLQGRHVWPSGSWKLSLKKRWANGIWRTKVFCQLQWKLWNYDCQWSRCLFNRHPLLNSPLKVRQGLLIMCACSGSPGWVDGVATLAHVRAYFITLIFFSKGCPHKTLIHPCKPQKCLGLYL